MKRLVFILILLLAAGTAAGDELEFAWEQEGPVVYWKLCWAETSGGPYNVGCIEIDYDEAVNMGYTAEINYPDGKKTTYYFVLVAFNSPEKFSANSNEVHYTLDRTPTPSTPFNLRIKIIAKEVVPLE